MRALFVSDLQLGAGQALAVGPYGEGSRFHEQTMMLERIHETANDENVDLICVLGDVFDRASPQPHEIIAFQDFVRRSLDAGRKVFCLVGNHDVRSAALPSALEIFAGDGCVVALLPGLFPVGDLALCALPWTPPSHMVAANPGVSRDTLNDLTAQALIQAASMLRARCEVEHPDKTALLLGHWAVSGATLPTGLDTSLLHEPVLSLDDLASSAFALAILGHIHLAAVLAPGPTPVVSCGSPWINSWGETEGEHGIWIFDSEAASLRFLPVADPRRFVTLEPQFVETSALGREPEYVMTLDGQAPALQGATVRLKYTVSEQVAARLDLAAIRQQILAQGATKVVFRPTVERAQRARVAEIADDLDETAALEMWLTSQQINGSLADGLRSAHVAYLEKVGQ